MSNPKELAENDNRSDREQYLDAIIEIREEFARSVEGRAEKFADEFEYNGRSQSHGIAEKSWIAGYNAANEWVKCSEAQPKDGEIIDIWNGVANLRAVYDKGGNRFWRFIDKSSRDRFIPSFYINVTHWLPLPEKPKRGEFNVIGKDK